MKTNSKADVGSIGSVNPLDYLTGNQRLYVFDYDEKQANLQSILEDNLKQHKKIIRLYRCFACEKNYSLQKMSNCLAVCRQCYQLVKSKGEVGKKNFIEKIVNNFHKFLRRRVSL